MRARQTIGVGITGSVIFLIFGDGLLAQDREIEWNTRTSNESRFSTYVPGSVRPAVPAPPSCETRANNTSEAVKKELALLQGRWQYTSGGSSGSGFMEISAFFQGGKDSSCLNWQDPAQDLAHFWDPYRLIVKGNEFHFGDGAPAGRTTATIDPTKNPKWIDFKDPKGRSWLGVYRVDGDKLILTIAYGNRRPRIVVDSIQRIERGEGCTVFTRAADESKDQIPTDISEKLKRLSAKLTNDFSNLSATNRTEGERNATASTRPDPPMEGFFEWMKGVDREYLSDYEKTDYWAAIAYSPTTGRYGTASELRGRDTASRVANDNCQAADARPVVLVGNGWCALAVGQDTSAWGVGWAQDRSTAEQYALEEANKRTTDCRILVSVFARN